MKILKILTFIISIFLFQNFAFSNFESTSTFVDGEKEFSKIHGEKNILYVHEDYIINPFSQSNIVQNQLNGSTNSYSVDNRIFNSSHPKYQGSSQIYENWKQSEPGVYTMIRLLENTYTRDGSNVLMPNQQVTVRKYYKVDFNFDKTPPTGGDLKLYNNQEATQSFTYQNGTWLNQPKYYTMTCNDPETGCKCDFNLTKTTENGWINENNHACTNSTEIIKKDGKVQTVPSIIGHLTKPTATFENNVNMSDNIEGSISGSSYVMYDQSSPRIGLGIIDSNNNTVKDFYYGSEINRDYAVRSSDGKLYDGEQIPGKVYYNIKNEVSLKANHEYKLGAAFMDQYINNSSNGISGIKNYSIKILKKDKSNNSYSEVYNHTKSYGVYNSDGTKESNDQKGKILEGLGELNESGEYKAIMEVYDWAGNHTKANSNFSIHPEGIDEGNTEMDYSLASSSNFANNSDYYEYTFSIRDKYNNPIYGKKLDIVGQDCSWITTGGCDELKADTVNKEGDSGIIIYDISNNSITNEQGEVKLKIKSVAPGVYTNSFLVKVNNWDEQYNNISEIIDFYVFSSEETEFIAPIKMDSIKVSNDNTNWDAQPEIGKDQKYKLQLNNNGSVNGYYDGVLKLSKENIKSKVNGHFWIDFSGVERNFGNNINTFLGFSGTIDGSANLLKGPEVENDELEINYKLANKNVAYFLDSKSINGCDRETLGLKVEGNIQGDGKSDITGQEENFSDLSMSETRSQIRQNAYQLIRNMPDGEIINGVKYVEGDYVLEANPNDYETLIVKEGNLIINKDINNSDNKLGIIVLKDNYDVNSDYNNAGNIYISNNVNYISASLYSDGAIRSAKSNGLGYNDSELLNDLEIFGSVFTRNTIGGAVDGLTSYTLPGGKETNDYKLASSYDLNYLRKSASCGDEYSLLIKYNPVIQVNPPAGFSN